MPDAAPPVARARDLERLSILDASFLHLERDVQQLHVGSVLLFEGPAPAYADLCALLGARLDLVPRYRQRVRRVPLDLGRPRWADDPQFDVRHHVRETPLLDGSAGADEDDVRRLAADLLSLPLDLDRPLWEMHLVTGLADGRWAVVNKVHHAMIDGVSGNDIMAVLLDGGPVPAPRRPSDVVRGRPDPVRGADVPAPPTWRPAPDPSRLALLGVSARDAAGNPVGWARTGISALRQPRQLASTAVSQAGGLLRLGGKVVRPETVLDGPLGPRRRWVWARSELAEVKAVKDRHGGTVNDVVLAAVTGGFRSFLQERGEDVDGRTIRSMVPVSRRPPGPGQPPGNQVSAVFADLPVGLADPVQRLHAITAQLSGLKSSGMADGVETLLAATGFLPPALLAAGTRIYARLPQRSISTVTTNVPGPQRPIYLLGRRMLEMFPYVPVASQVRITIAIVSYDGHLTFGVTGDHDAVPDVAVLAEAIEAAMADLVATCR